MLKGAIRRVFARSDLRKQVLEESRIEHYDPNRPRVTKWSWCAICGAIGPTYLMEVDHIEPVIPLDKTMEHMTLDEVVDRTWCDKNNLQVIDDTCHDVKTKAERALRPKRPRKTKGKK